MLVLMFDVGLVWAGGTIYIRPDGTVDPPTAPISRDGDIYTFTDNISGTFVIERDNIVVNGAGYTLQRPGNGTLLFGRSNVTIKNMEIKADFCGISLSGSSDIIVEGNTIRDTDYGVMLWNSANNKFYHNNFINNTDHVYNAPSYGNAWDDGYPSGGNYWSNYVVGDHYSGPGQDEPGSDGIGDTLYFIDSNNQDNYPLMEPWIPPILTVIGPWSGEELDKFVPVLEEFEVRTGINTAYDCIPSYELVNTLPEMFEAETTPGDVIFVWPWFVREIGLQGHAVNATSLISETDFRPEVLDEVKVEGTLYGGSYTGKAKPGFWYRKSFFEANYLAEPTTWEEFVALLDAIAAIEGIVNPIVSGDNVGWPLSDVTEHFLITFGGPQLQRDLISGETKWIRPPVRTIFEEKLVPLLDAGYFSVPMEWVSALEAWWAGDYGLYFMGSWITGMVDPPEDLGVFSLPGGEGLVFAADYFFIPEYTEYPDEAIQLFEFLASADAQEIQVAQGGHIATNVLVSLDAYPPVDRVIAEVVEGTEALPDLDDAIGGEFQTTFWEQMKRLWMHPGELDEVLEAIQAVAPPKTWTVDDDGPADFATIQGAINAATDRDTIFVHSGTYYENVDVNKSVSLIGEDRWSTIVDGLERGCVLNVTRDNVEIVGFTIQHSAVDKPGVYLDGVNYCSIAENNITDNFYGVRLLDSSDNRVCGNNVTNSFSFGITLGPDSNDNRISGNNVSTSYNGSIRVYASLNNRISNNYITDTYYGILLDSSFGTTLSGNDIIGNEVGVSTFLSENNSIYHNNFLDNTQQVEVQSSGYFNLWDDYYPSGGNYWSDYLGVDLYSGPGQNEPGGDGIGDTSYVIDGENEDAFPLMEPWHARVNVDPTISYAMVGEAVRIDVGVAEVTDLYGFEFVVGYNKSLLDAMEVFIQPFLNEPIDVFRMEVNEELGLVWVDAASQPPAEPVYGSGALATIFFRVVGFGGCVLDLYDTRLSDPDGLPIDHLVEDGYYEGGMTQVVSTESSLGSYHPSLAVDLDGNVHVAWHDDTDLECGTDRDIFYKRYEAATADWTPTEVVSTGCDGTSAYPSLAVDSAGNVHVAWHDNTTDLGGSGIDFDIVYRRFEVGVGWADIEVVSAESTSDSLHPSLAVDLDGNVHVAWHDETDLGGGTDWDIFYKNRTSSWSTTEVISTQNPSNRDSLRPSLAVDSSENVHIAWDDVTNYAGSGSDSDVFYRRYDVGVGWADIEVVSTESTLGSYDVSLAVDSGGNVHVAWHDDTDLECGTDRDIFYKRYEVGVDWTPVEVVSNESNADSWYPSLAVDSSRNVYIAWDDRPVSNWTVFYKRYELVKADWTRPQVVSTESTENSWGASLAVDSSRNVHIAWHDVTDYAGCGSDADIFYKYLCLHSTTYPWPMFHHNPRHTGYTESPAPNTNQTQWTYTTDDSVESSPAIADGKVFIGSNDGKVYALDQYTGARIWNYTIGNGVVSSPAVVYGKVYVGSLDARVYCLDAATGAHLWNRTTGNWINTSPAVAYGKVYVGSYDGKVYCFDAVTGEFLWNRMIGNWIAYSSPAVAYGKVYAGSLDGRVYCLDASTGAYLWNRTIGGVVYSSPGVAYGKVYVGSSDGRVYCLDAVNGAYLWNRTIGGLVFSSPAIAYGKVFAGSGDGKACCLDAETGAPIWNRTIGSYVRSSPAIADDKVYVGSADGRVYCLDASTGTHIWNYTTGSPVWSSPAVADGMVFIGSNDNTVYALGSVIRVPEDYPTIQGAINAAEPEDTISIAPGTYHESLVIDKPLTLVGRKGSSTTFAGGGSGIAVNITDTSYVTITNIDITYWNQGIYLDNSSDCQIYNNVMYLMGDSGVVVDGENAANNQIYNNVFQDNNIAIDVAESSTGNIIYGNTISQNSIGINVLDSGDNTIYCNSFINNGQQVNISSQPNAWDYGSLGNYWSDYTGTDADGDGIGDTPYLIDSNNQDNFPLMSPYDYWNNPMLGDVNMDAMVNAEDLSQLAAAYGATPEKPNWNPYCDLNNDYKIAVLDLFNLSKKYGEAAP